jgi:hypothetical protein
LARVSSDKHAQGSLFRLVFRTTNPVPFLAGPFQRTRLVKTDEDLRVTEPGLLRRSIANAQDEQWQQHEIVPEQIRADAWKPQLMSRGAHAGITCL